MQTEFVHIPVLLAEVLAGLSPRPGGWYVDGTVGGGGHAAAILEASGPDGRLWGGDQDGMALAAAGKRLAKYAGRFELRRGNFSELREWLGPGKMDGVLLDLGVSSPQLDTPGRGFSFQADGPLDMRMDDRSRVTAAELVNGLEPEELARIFRQLGEEPQARRIAERIGQERKLTPLRTTGQLAALVERICPRRGQPVHPATRVFMALRLAVNDELGVLRQGLVAAVDILRPGGRLCVISFHSLEARMVKEYGREQCRDYDYPGEVDVPELRRPCPPGLRAVTRKAVLPGEAEVKANPRSRSAQLRVYEKV